MSGFTQAEVATKLGVDRSTVGHWESKRRPDEPGPANFKRLCALYGCAASDLLAGPDDKAA